MRTRFLRSFPVQVADPDEAVREAASALDATGRAFLVFVAVGDDARVAYGPDNGSVTALVRALQLQATLDKVAAQTTEE